MCIFACWANDQKLQKFLEIVKKLSYFRIYENFIKQLETEVKIKGFS